MVGDMSLCAPRKSIGSMRICVVAVYLCGVSSTKATARAAATIVDSRIVILPRHRTDQIFLTSIGGRDAKPRLRSRLATAADGIWLDTSNIHADLDTAACRPRT